MYIESIKYRLPGKKISNEECLDRIRKKVAHEFNGQEEAFEEILNKVKYYFEKSGADNRNFLKENETPIGLLKEAFNEALDETGWKKEEIDLLIYVGVCRGFLEPGGSYMTAHALDIYNVDCFDILDACMSWTRALYIADHFIKAGSYKKIAIVNAEFNMENYDDGYNVKSIEQIDYLFPVLTIGEAASVTLISDKSDSDFKFTFNTNTELAEYCTIPVPNFKLFTDKKSERIGKHGPLKFTSYGKEMHTLGAPLLLSTFQKLGVTKQEMDIVFTHASSSKIWEKYGQLVGIDDKMYHIFPKTGNLVSASIPVSMAMAKEDGKLKRDDRVFLWIGSAGMSTAAVHFKY